MIIEIRDDLYFKLVDLMKNRNTTIYNELKEIKPIAVATDTTLLQQAREVKTQKVKQSIKENIKELLNQDISPTKYQIHKRTKIAYVTINKYYDDILEEVTNATK